MPVPQVPKDDMSRVADASRAYLNAVTPSTGVPAPDIDNKAASELLLHVDAEILRLYDLPPRVERELLDLFAGKKRLGVPFEFDRYFPEDFEPCFSLHEYLSEDYQRSTAGELRARHETVTSPTLLAAIKRAVEDFGE